MLPARKFAFFQELEPETSLATSTAAPLQDHQFATNCNWWALAPAMLAFAAISVPYLLTRGNMSIGLPLARGFALVCHQHPDRSFWLFGAPVAVCTRCLGIYSGAAIGSLLQISRRIAIRVLTIAAAVNVVDFAMELTGLHGNWMVSRCVLGIALGAAASLLISSLDFGKSRRVTPRTPPSLQQS